MSDSATRTAALLLLMLFVMPTGAAHAELTRVEITTRASIGDSGFEKIVGVAHFAVDPKNARNTVIADIDHAPRNGAGRVEFASDIYIIQPTDPARSNGIALVDVANRGNKVLLTFFMRGAVSDPKAAADLGDRFLLDQGFTLVWIGWEFDVPMQSGRIGTRVPSAVGIRDFVRAELVPANGDPRQTFTDLAGYAPFDAGAAENSLSVRSAQFDASTAIDRARWTLAGNTVTLTGGFEAGRIYQLAYRAKELPIAGLGLAAVRDVAAWMRHAPDALVRPRQLLTYGASQSGRFLRTFFQHGFNTDEQGRPVYDAAWIHIAGAAGLSLNERGATPTSLSGYTITRFPFASQAMRDPVTGVTDGVVEHPGDRARPPKIFATNSSVEYWGLGRSAALIHVSPDGTRDLPLPENERIYFLTGAPHYAVPFPPSVTDAQLPDNPFESIWTMRALMVGMEQWMLKGTLPPPSRYPRLSDGSLVRSTAIRFPAVPGVQSPAIIPPAREHGKERPLLVSKVDEDGNEIAGVRAAEALVPMAAYTGWNFRHPSTGGTKLVVNLRGASIPFPRTAAERAAAHDPRRAIGERYPSRDAYLAEARRATDSLVKGRFLRPQDITEVMRRMELQWSHATGAPAPSR